MSGTGFCADVKQFHFVPTGGAAAASPNLNPHPPLLDSDQVLLNRLQMPINKLIALFFWL